jgi:hypothetical protein
MTRLLLCTATILALTASANAQSSSMGNAYFGPSGTGSAVYKQPRPIPKYKCVIKRIEGTIATPTDCQPVRQQVQKSSVRNQGR